MRGEAWCREWARRICVVGGDALTRRGGRGARGARGRQGAGGRRGRTRTRGSNARRGRRASPGRKAARAGGDGRDAETGPGRRRTGGPTAHARPRERPGAARGNARTPSAPATPATPTRTRKKTQKEPRRTARPQNDAGGPPGFLSVEVCCACGSGLPCAGDVVRALPLVHSRAWVGVLPADSCTRAGAASAADKRRCALGMVVAAADTHVAGLARMDARSLRCAHGCAHPGRRPGAPGAFAAGAHGRLRSQRPAEGDARASQARRPERLRTRRVVERAYARVRVLDPDSFRAVC